MTELDKRNANKYTPKGNEHGYLFFTFKGVPRRIFSGHVI